MNSQDWMSILTIALDIIGPALALLLVVLAVRVAKKFGIAVDSSMLNILLKRAYSLVGLAKSAAEKKSNVNEPDRQSKVTTIAKKLKDEADRLGITNVAAEKLIMLAETAVDADWKSLPDEDGDGIPDVIDPDIVFKKTDN